MRRLVFILPWVLLFFACQQAGRDFAPPDLKAPAAFRAPVPPGDSAKELGRWWEHFDDPLLSAQIATALSGNPDLKAAKDRVRGARALAKASRGGLWPTAEALAAWLTQSDPEHPGPFLSRPATVLPVDVPAVRWDLDIFGATRRGVEVLEAGSAGAKWLQFGVRVALAADVARSEFLARGWGERLRVAREKVGAREDALRLAEARFAGGLSTEAPVAQARARWSEAQAALLPIRQAQAAALHRLSILCGQKPGGGEPWVLPQVPMAPAVRPGLPADMLRRRPDVALAEAALRAATARIGVEEAELYPRFSLGGSVHASVGSPDDFWEGKSYTFSFGPSMRWRLFDRVRIKQRVAAAGAQADAALGDFDAAVLTALEEVETALAAVDHGRARTLALDAVLRDAARSAQVARALYEKGLGDFTAVLDEQSRLYDAKDAQVEARVRLALDTVTLYQALGGGWEEETKAPAAAP